jgi:hypothetical protein
MTDRLSIKNFAQIGSVDLEFADLTVLVGAQGTGKSLALQWLKIALDGPLAIQTLADAGNLASGDWSELLFGRGMVRSPKTRVAWNGDAVQTSWPIWRTKRRERLYFIPAHRSLLVDQGWPLPLEKFDWRTPFVARRFSHSLFELFRDSERGPLFPGPRRLSPLLRQSIDDAVFHGGSVRIGEERSQRLLQLTHGKAVLPFMVWTSGQREFAPLLMGLYQLVPEGRQARVESVDWVVIEEPEMGLHPQAISVVMLLVLDLMRRGYRVVLSTHSPHLLTAVWMLQRLKDFRARWQLVCDGFGIAPRRDAKALAEVALAKSYRVHLLEFGKGDKVFAKDISGLNPGAEDDAESGWGGLTGFSSKFGEAVRKAANEVDS